MLIFPHVDGKKAINPQLPPIYNQYPIARFVINKLEFNTYLVVGLVPQTLQGITVTGNHFLQLESLLADCPSVCN